MDKRISIIGDVLKRPTFAFKKINLEGKNYFFGALTVIIISHLISIIFTPQLFDLGNAILNFIGVFLGITILFYIGTLFKGKAKFKGLFSTMGYAYVPIIIGTLFASIMFRISGLYEIFINLKDISLNLNEILAKEQIDQLLSSLISPMGIATIILLAIVTVWSFVLSIFAYRESNKFTNLKTIGVMFLSYIIIFIIVTILNFLIISIIL